MRSAWFLPVLALAACDQVLGLDERTNSSTDAPVGGGVDGCWDLSFIGDEDGDTLVDGCDNCPLVTNETQDDRDDDGVGDACDPNPMLALEEIAFFEPMPRYVAASWTAYGAGSWVTGIGNINIKQENQGDASRVVALLVYDASAVDHPMIQIKILGATPSGDASDLSVVGVALVVDATLDNPPPDGMLCGIEFPAISQTTVRAWSRVQQAPTVHAPLFAAMAMGSFESVITLATSAPVQGTELGAATCTVERGGEVVSAPPGPLVASAGAKVGLLTFNAAATFQALFVTRRRPGT